MKSYLDIVAELNYLNLKKKPSFTDGNYKFNYHSHSTGRCLIIYVVDHSSGESLIIYKDEDWFNRDEDKTRKFQIEGPWVSQIQSLIEKFSEEIQAEKVLLQERQAKYVENQGIKKSETIERFTKLVEKPHEY